MGPKDFLQHAARADASLYHRSMGPKDFPQHAARTGASLVQQHRLLDQQH